MIICLSGFATSGKDTFYKLLRSIDSTPFLSTKYEKADSKEQVKKLIYQGYCPIVYSDKIIPEGLESNIIYIDLSENDDFNKIIKII